MTQTVEIAPKRQTRRHPTEWKRTIVELTIEPGTSVARAARENGINANQVWAWRVASRSGGATTCSLVPTLAANAQPRCIA
ncbi:TPA: transposase [Burkholderia aenigmatica]|nr:transposase [Burkholderia aenigmatica]HDR9488479.1 transposase [Burkholderia aenigmatica]HDR9513891.1 transposase [Burkholderia aenigmatica]HDR9520659.1 transposase [Burkholderia aenigmatica]HDR9591282.1 transposase [Burkholderia aenigmatica]